MGKVIRQTQFEVLDPGTYRGRVGSAVIEEGVYGSQLAVRFDITEQGYEDKSLKAWASAKLSGGKRPSKLWQWSSVLIYAGRPVPEGYDLDVDDLIGREALLVVEVVNKDGADYNRVGSLLPLRQAAPVRPAVASTTAPAIPNRAPVTAAGAAGVPVRRATVPAYTADPGEVPAWMNDDGGAEAAY